MAQYHYSPNPYLLTVTLMVSHGVQADFLETQLLGRLRNIFPSENYEFERADGGSSYPILRIKGSGTTRDYPLDKIWNSLGPMGTDEFTRNLIVIQKPEVFNRELDAIVQYIQSFRS